METGKELLCFKDQLAYINGAAFSPAGERLAAALHDGSVRPWAAGAGNRKPTTGKSGH